MDYLEELQQDLLDAVGFELGLQHLGESRDMVRQRSAAAPKHPQLDLRT